MAAESLGHSVTTRPDGTCCSHYSARWSGGGREGEGLCLRGGSWPTWGWGSFEAELSLNPSLQERRQAVISTRFACRSAVEGLGASLFVLLMTRNGRVHTSTKYLPKTAGSSFSVYTGGVSSQAMEVSSFEGLCFSFAGVMAPVT